MGLFLEMSGVIGKNEKEVTKVLEEYTKMKKGTMVEVEPQNEAFDLCVIGGNSKNTTVVYPDDFFDWDEASEYLSRELNTSVFSLHIHDSDLWMYIFYNCGKAVDQFNPIPDYWEELSSKEMNKWKGNPKVICDFVKDVEIEDIKNYYRFWEIEMDDDSEEKAYEEDESYFGDDWQIIDFMNKLSLTYPLEEETGFPIGKTYKFKVSNK